MENLETTANPAPAENEATGPIKLATLELNRKTIRRLNDEILSTQGHSLWTCENTTGR